MRSNLSLYAPRSVYKLKDLGETAKPSISSSICSRLALDFASIEVCVSYCIVSLNAADIQRNNATLNNHVKKNTGLTRVPVGISRQ
jgi:hypothetical protein